MDIIEIYSKSMKFYFEIKGKIVVIGGDSGTGKTLFFNAVIENGGVDNPDSPTVALSRESLMDAEILKLIVEKNEDKIFVIDNAEYLLTRESIDIINNDINNRYIIIGRGVNIRGLRTSFLSYAEIYLDKEENTFKLNYPLSRENRKNYILNSFKGGEKI